MQEIIRLDLTPDEFRVLFSFYLVGISASYEIAGLHEAKVTSALIGLQLLTTIKADPAQTDQQLKNKLAEFLPMLLAK
jgi:hypothetical protein